MGGLQNAYPPRLVQLVMHRWATGATFESFVRPERPLGPRVHAHAEVPKASIESGPEASQVIEFIDEFLEPEDVLVAWGRFPYELLERAGRPVPTRHDIRIAASEWLHKRPGTPRDVLAASNGEPRAPIGQGRAGRVMGELCGVLDAWARLVDAPASVQGTGAAASPRPIER